MYVLRIYHIPEQSSLQVTNQRHLNLLAVFSWEVWAHGCGDVIDHHSIRMAWAEATISVGVGMPRNACPL